MLKRRGGGERTFGWLGNCRRLGKDCEFLPACEENLIYLPTIRLILRRPYRPAK